MGLSKRSGSSSPPSSVQPAAAPQRFAHFHINRSFCLFVTLWSPILICSRLNPTVQPSIIILWSGLVPRDNYRSRVYTVTTRLPLIFQRRCGAIKFLPVVKEVLWPLGKLTACFGEIFREPDRSSTPPWNYFRFMLWKRPSSVLAGFSASWPAFRFWCEGSLRREQEDRSFCFFCCCSLDEINIVLRVVFVPN